MARVTPQQAAEKWARRLSQATPDIQRGVENTTINPMERAAAAQDRMVSRWNESITNGKYKAGLARVSLPDWKQAMIQKGMPRIQAGVTQAQPKMQAFMEQMLPYQDRLSATIDAMPNVTIEDSIARMTAQVRGMVAFNRSGSVARR